MTAISERRVECLQLNYEFLDTLSERLGSHPWSLAGGVNLALVSWLHRHLVETGELPQDSVPTWAWPDPSCGQLMVLVYSQEFDVSPEGQHAPYRLVLLDREKFEAALDRDCPPELRKATCGGCGRRKNQLIVEGHAPGCEFDVEVDHSQHGRGSPEGPVDSDCPCRGSALEVECARSGCGFCSLAGKR